MTYGATEIIRGAAVVIDDRIDDPDDALQSILKQLRDADVPLITLRSLPSIESLVYWKQFGLIVLDWELSYSSADDSTSIPVGVTVPSELAAGTRQHNFEFISYLLNETALPVFVASNADLEDIRGQLAGAFPDQASGLQDRVMVFGKGELEVSLFETIGVWINSRPALRALDAWSRAYVDAEIAAFHEFSRAEEDWVVSVQRAARADSASFGATLRGLIASSIVNRIGALRLEMADPADAPLSDAAALRRVLHLSAVIPDEALDPSEPGTGDLYVPVGAPQPYPEIRILLTPECDLVRGDVWRYTYLPAIRKVPDPEKQQPASGKRVERIGRPERLHVVTSLLTPAGDEYDIALKDWESISVARWSGPVADDGSGSEPGLWPGFARIGRLLDPYLTHIQQQFALTTIRKGLPRLPVDFFEGWATQ